MNMHDDYPHSEANYFVEIRGDYCSNNALRIHLVEVRRENIVKKVEC